jgi:6-phosphogluconolactonase (cycloisomerase 2 family)
MKKLRTAVLAAIVGVGALMSVTALSPAQAVAAAPVITPTQQNVALAGSPFGVVPTPDGKYVFTSESGSAFGIAILEQEGSATNLIGTIETGDPAFGLAITNDGKYLLAAVRKTGPTEPRAAGVEIIDVEKAIAGEPEAILGDIAVTAGSGPIEVEMSNDSRYAFVADEDNLTVGVINVEAAITSGVSASDVVGYIPVDNAPVGMALSPDGTHLYISNEKAQPTDPGYNANACEIPTGEETGTRAPGAEGSLTIVNLQEAETTPTTSVISTVLAGCQPVRINLSNDGAVAWVTDRSSNEVAAYSTERLLTDPANALISVTPVGESPVGIEFFDDEQLIAVANSNRFNAGQAGTVSILNARKALRGEGEAATLASFEGGEFPREFGLSADDQFLYMTKFSSDALAVFPVADLAAEVHPVDEFELALSTSGTGSGAFTCEVEGGADEPCGPEYEVGTEVEVIPAAASGSAFVEWTGDCTGSGPCLLEVGTDKSVGAVFKDTSSVGSGGNGSGGGGNSGSATSPPPVTTPSGGSGGSGKPSKVELGSTEAHGSSASLALTVSGAGTVAASGKGLAAAKVKAKHSGSVKLELKLTGAEKRTLLKKGVVKVKVKIVFTPTGGSPRTITKTVTFKAKKDS